MDKQVEDMIPVCKMCGRKLGVFIGTMNGELRIICSSDYVENWDYCYSCMIEHCCTTNCFGCRLNPGNYNDCRFFDMKRNYMED